MPDSNSTPIINFEGNKVALGPLRRDLLPVYQRWINDFEVTRTLKAAARPFTMEAEEAWFEGAAKSEDSVGFTIYQREGLHPIGNTGLHHIDHCQRTAEFGIMIGEKDCWGKGFGTETTRLMLEFAFTGLGLHAVMLHVYSYNQRAADVYERAGFTVAGRLRQFHRLGGKAYDVILMDCLASEFVGSVLQRLMPSDE